MWLYSIKNMSKQSFCPNTVEGTEVEELFRQAELAKMTEEQRISFEISVMSRNDMLNSFRETLEAAKEEVKAKGLAEGRAEGINSVIKQMHTKGMSIQQIADIVEMPVDEIQAIVQL